MPFIAEKPLKYTLEKTNPMSTGIVGQVVHYHGQYQLLPEGIQQAQNKILSDSP